VTIEPFAEEILITDDDAREIVRGARGGTPFVIPAQIAWKDREMAIYAPGGARYDDDGSILVRFVDMEALGIMITRGDRITAIGRMTDQSLYITDQEPCGHWADQNGATMIKFYFSQRRPSREP
jgi:hypothetical protein